MSDKTIAVQVDPFMGNGIDGYGTISGEQVVQHLLRLSHLDEAHQREAQSNLLKNPYRFEAIVVDREYYRNMCQFATEARRALEKIVETQVPAEISAALRVLENVNRQGSR